jgi:hypothetical protein
MKDLKLGRGPPELGRPRSSFRLGQRVPEQPPRAHAQLVDWAHFLSGVEIAGGEAMCGCGPKGHPAGRRAPRANQNPEPTGHPALTPACE